MGAQLRSVVLVVIYLCILSPENVQSQFNFPQLDFVFKLTGVNLKPIKPDWGVDGFVKVYVSDFCVGRSETIVNNKNPKWQESFRARYTPGFGQTLRIEVRHNNAGAPDNALGDAYINLDAPFNNPVELRRDGSSQGHVRIERTMEGEIGGGKC